MLFRFLCAIYTKEELTNIGLAFNKLGIEAVGFPESYAAEIGSQAMWDKLTEISKEHEGKNVVVFQQEEEQIPIKINPKEVM